MWLIRAALRRPITRPGRGHRGRADGGICGEPDAGGHLSGSRSAGHLRRAAVRRDEPGADGGVHHLLLRVPLPLRQRHRERRVEVDSEHQPAEADVSSRDRHGGSARADHRLRQSRARLHAARHRRPVHHALRCRHGAGRLPGLLERQPQPRRDSGPGAEPRATAVRHAARPDLAAAVRRQSAHHRDPRGSGSAAVVQHVAGRSDPRGDDRQRHHAVWQRQHRR